MAVLAAAYSGDARFTDKPARRGRFLVVTSEVIYSGALVGIHDGSGAGTQGQVAAYDANTAGLRFLGLNIGDDVTGDGSAVAVVDYSGLEIQRADVVGVSAATVVGDPVYCDSDNIDDATLTRPSGALEAIGIIVLAEDVSNAVATVRLKDGLAALQAAKVAAVAAPSTTYSAAGAISLPVLRDEVAILDGSAATAAMTLAVPSQAAVGSRLWVHCSDSTNIVDCDYTDAGGAARTITFVAGEGVLLFAASTTGWARSSIPAT